MFLFSVVLVTDHTHSSVIPCRQNEAGSMCQFSYGIDTHRDKSLYRAQMVGVMLLLDLDVLKYLATGA